MCNIVTCVQVKAKSKFLHIKILFGECNLPIFCGSVESSRIYVQTHSSLQPFNMHAKSLGWLINILTIQ